MFIASSLQLALALLLFSACFVISQTTTTPSTSNNNNNSIQKPKPADYTHASEILKTVESGLNAGHLNLPGSILDSVANGVGKMATTSKSRRSIIKLFAEQD